jgi:hypothetical protein
VISLALYCCYIKMDQARRDFSANVSFCLKKYAESDPARKRMADPNVLDLIASMAFFNREQYTVESAIAFDNVEMLQYLLETTNERSLDSILVKAARAGSIDVAIFVLNLGARVNAHDGEALRSAAEYGHAEVVKALLAAGADVRSLENYALRWAAANGHVDVVRVLLAAGADPCANYNFAIKWASREGHLEVVKELIAAGAEVASPICTALNDAAYNGHVEIVKLLIANRADIKGMSAYQVQKVLQRGHDEVYRLLINAGAVVREPVIYHDSFPPVIRDRFSGFLEFSYNAVHVPDLVRDPIHKRVDVLHQSINLAIALGIEVQDTREPRRGARARQLQHRTAKCKNERYNNARRRR